MNAAIARCSASCAGWFVDEAGVIRCCGRCRLYASDDEAGEAVQDILLAAQHDSMREGWAVFWSDVRGAEIERDDEAARFPSDDDAIAVAIPHLARLTGFDVSPRAGRGS